MCSQDGLDGCTSNNVHRVKKLFLKHGEFIKVIIGMHIDDKEDADDFFQELFLFLIVKPLPENVRSPKGLLSKIVSDRAKDYYRKKASYKRRISKYSEITQANISSETPETDFVEKEEVDMFCKMVKRNLSPKESEAVILKYQHDHNITEIANKMEINSRSVSRYLSIGLKKLKKIWA